MKFAIKATLVVMRTIMAVIIRMAYTSTKIIIIWLG